MMTCLFALFLTAEAAPPEIGPLATEEWVRETNARWRGVGIGYDNGLWGSRFAQGLKVDVPLGNRLGQFLGVRARGTLVHNDANAQFAPVAMGGLELFGRGPVLLGVLRVYGGGGLYYGGPVGGEAAPATLAGGGHYGVEFLVSRRASFSFEVGGQGPLHPQEIDAGASVMAGSTVYLGRSRR